MINKNEISLTNESNKKSELSLLLRQQKIRSPATSSENLLAPKQDFTPDEKNLSPSNSSHKLKGSKYMLEHPESPGEDPLYSLYSSMGGIKLSLSEAGNLDLSSPKNFGISKEEYSVRRSVSQLKRKSESVSRTSRENEPISENAKNFKKACEINT